MSVDKGDEESGSSSLTESALTPSQSRIGMNSPPRLKSKSVVLSLVLEEVTDDDEGEEEDVVDGGEGDVADDDLDGLVISAFKRQESAVELEQQERGTYSWTIFRFQSGNVTEL